MTIHQRIEYIIEAKEKTKKKFCANTGIPQSTLSMIITRGTKPSHNFYNSIILTYQDLNARWLITGEGEPWLDAEKDAEIIKLRGELAVLADEKEKYKEKAGLGKDVTLEWIKDLKKENAQLKRIIMKRNPEIAKMMGWEEGE